MNDNAAVPAAGEVKRIPQGWFGTNGSGLTYLFPGEKGETHARAFAESTASTKEEAAAWLAHNLKLVAQHFDPYYPVPGTHRPRPNGGRGWQATNLDGVSAVCVDEDRAKWFAQSSGVTFTFPGDDS
jgi:hypothetical protein